jgi:CubicO group peptidase (beta-lactamase class C family)
VAAVPDAAEVFARAREERERLGVQGFALGLLSDGEAVTFADGFASVEARAPVTPETSFRIASITKPFTATLALALAEEGRLPLDEPLRDDLTPRLLLSHQAGLACEWPRPLADYGEGDDALERLARDEPAAGPAGSRGVYSYSNAGYWLVAAAAARALGTTYEDALRERVLAPLRLERTGFEPRGPGAVGHEQRPGSAEVRAVGGAYPRVRRPSGGLWSTVGDLLRFAAHHLGGPGPLSADAARAMRIPQVDFSGGAYGLGWSTRRVDGREIVEHGGSVLGYESLLLLAPDERLALAVLTNSRRGDVAIRGVLEMLGLAPDLPRGISLSEYELRAFAGLYRAQGGEVTVTPLRDGLRLRIVEIDPFDGERVEEPALTISPVGPREFVVFEGDLRGELIDFPGPRWIRVGGLLAERVET